MPRKLKMISAPTNPASPAETDTITGLMTFGKTWALRIRGGTSSNSSGRFGILILPHLQNLAADQSGHAKPGEGAQRESNHHVIYKAQANYPIDAGSILEGPYPLYKARPEGRENKENQEYLRKGGGYFSYSHYH